MDHSSKNYRFSPQVQLPLSFSTWGNNPHANPHVRCLGLNHHFGCCDPFIHLRWRDPFLPCLMVKPCQNPSFLIFPFVLWSTSLVSTAAPGHQVQALKQPAGSPGPWSAAPGFFHRCRDEQVAMGSVGKSLVFTCFYSDLYRHFLKVSCRFSLILKPLG